MGSEGNIKNYYKNKLLDDIPNQNDKYADIF
jgi:hypothetical protein